MSLDENRQADRDRLPSSADKLAPSAPAGTESTTELFERAVRLHSRRLLAIARAIVGHRASPEDVVQQAFMNLYQHRDRYDWREAGGLMRRTVVNEALRILRQPRISALPDEAGDPSGPSQSPGGHMIESETVLQVRRAIDRLPENFRAALVLCAVRRRLSYAKRSRKHLTPAYPRSKPGFTEADDNWPKCSEAMWSKRK